MIANPIVMCSHVILMNSTSNRYPTATAIMKQNQRFEHHRADKKKAGSRLAFAIESLRQQGCDGLQGHRPRAAFTGLMISFCELARQGRATPHRRYTAAMIPQHSCPCPSRPFGTTIFAPFLPGRPSAFDEASRSHARPRCCDPRSREGIGTAAWQAFRQTPEATLQAETPNSE
jgi:hypothetical protein